VAVRNKDYFQFQLYWRRKQPSFERPERRAKKAKEVFREN
jgi:hypothetical protein